jgi:hypothetical protein
VKFYRFCRTIPQFFSNLFISQQTSVNTARGGCNESHRFYASFRVIPLPDSINSSVINFKWISPQIRHVPLCDQPSRPTLPSAFSTPDTAKIETNATHPRDTLPKSGIKSAAGGYTAATSSVSSDR